MEADLLPVRERDREAQRMLARAHEPDVQRVERLRGPTPRVSAAESLSCAAICFRWASCRFTLSARLAQYAEQFVAARPSALCRSTGVGARRNGLVPLILRHGPLSPRLLV
jgi:hypothetical protein